MRKRSWNRVPGSVVVDADFCQVVIDFESSGYYDPGVRSGPVDRCYPPEGDDERTVTAVTLSFDEGDVRLPTEIAAELAETYRDEIAAAEVDFDNYCTL